MHPLKQLRQLMKESSPTQGKVVKVGNELRIATSQGSLSITPQANDATVYRVGDSVILANGMVVGRRLPTPTTYVI
jgi:uncharacterized cupin superfamily protein